MKNIFKKSLCAFILILLVCTSLCSCGLKIDPESSLYVNTIDFTNAVISNDRATAYDIVKDAVSEEDFNENFDSLHETLAEVGNYKLTVVNYSIGINDGYHYKRAIFLLESEEGDFLISVQELEEYEGLVSYYVDPDVDGTVSKQSSAAKIIVSGINLLGLVLVIAAFIDCLKNCKRGKVLWAILIAIGKILIKFSAGNISVSLTLGIHIFSSQSLIIPAAAVVWFCLRKKMCTPDPNVIENPTFDDEPIADQAQADTKDGE